MSILHIGIFIYIYRIYDEHTVHEIYVESRVKMALKKLAELRSDLLYTTPPLTIHYFCTSLQSLYYTQRIYFLDSFFLGSTYVVMAAQDQECARQRTAALKSWIDPKFFKHICTLVECLSKRTANSKMDPKTMAK